MPDLSRAWGAGRAQFTTTHWTVILAAGEKETPYSVAALEALCRTYWQPLYGYIRQRGYSPPDAQDLTQAYFARVLERDFLRGVDRSKGKFRSFLLATLDHFLANEWRNGHTQKRGGRFSFVSLEDTLAEQQYCEMAAAGLSPEQLFERQWATTLLERVLGRLHDEFVASGRETLFEEIKIFLTGEKQTVSYATLAAGLGTTVAGLKMAVSRMRHRYGELVREEIAATVASPEEIDGELQAMFSALSL
ncbi:MAG TPA: sigma-70 family RNA polymerase sigma factor [Verrucomicrobiae bacterium]